MLKQSADLHKYVTLKTSVRKLVQHDLYSVYTRIRSYLVVVAKYISISYGNCLGGNRKRSSHSKCHIHRKRKLNFIHIFKFSTRCFRFGSWKARKCTHIEILRHQIPHKQNSKYTCYEEG